MLVLKGGLFWRLGKVGFIQAYHHHLFFEQDVNVSVIKLHCLGAIFSVGRNLGNALQLIVNVMFNKVKQPSARKCQQSVLRALQKGSFGVLVHSDILILSEIKN